MGMCVNDIACSVFYVYIFNTLLVPAIKQCIENVDVENGKMQIRLLEGLIG